MADEYLEGIMNRQSPAMTAQDVVGVIAEKIRRRASFIQRWNNTSSPERHKTLEDEAVEAAAELIEAASLLESQAQALSDANGNADTYCKWWREQRDRTLAAESRLAEAMRVIDAADKRFEKIALCIERNLYHQREKVEDARSLAIQGREAARDFVKEHDKP